MWFAKYLHTRCDNMVCAFHEFLPLRWEPNVLRFSISAYLCKRIYLYMGCSRMFAWKIRQTNAFILFNALQSGTSPSLPTLNCLTFLETLRLNTLWELFDHVGFPRHWFRTSCWWLYCFFIATRRHTETSAVTPWVRPLCVWIVCMWSLCVRLS